MIKRLLPILFVLAFADSAFAQWTKGLNFRATAGYCVDPADTTYAFCGDGGVYDAYPTTRNGLTFGWNDGAFNDCRRDRDSAVDCRLAGKNNRNDSTTNSIGKANLRIDLPNAGTFDIRLALGDASFSQTNEYFEIYDNTTLLATVTNSGTFGPAQWVDATGVVRTSAADWVNNNQPLNLTFASAILNIKYANPAGTGSGSISHIMITEVTATPTPTPTPTGTQTPTPTPTSTATPTPTPTPVTAAVIPMLVNQGQL